MKVKLDKTTMINCVVAYDENNFYVFNNNFIKIGSREIIIQRKDESYDIVFNENFAVKTLFYEFKFIIYVNKRILILEDPIEGDIQNFFNDFALRGVNVSKLSKTKYF